MRSLTARFVLLIVTAAVVPLLLFAFVSVRSLRQGTERSVIQGNLNVAARAAEQVAAYVTGNIAVLRAIGAELHGTRLAAWQQDRVAKNFVLEFPEFREISFFAADGTTLATSRIGAARLTAPAPAPGTAANIVVAPITIDDDLLPTTTISVPVGALEGVPAGWIVGEIRLEELWRMVDRIRVGQEGFALVISEDARLVAHGNPNRKRHIASGEARPEHALAVALREDRTWQTRYRNEEGDTTLATGALIRPFNWSLFVEQPIREAFATADRLERQLVVAILGALLITLVVGIGWSRPLVRRISLLRRGTEALAAGRLDARVSVGGRDEVRQLGDAFNTMAGRLAELQDNLRRQERQATFGRVAAGLVHDLSQPVQSIANSCKLLFRAWEDLEYRTQFREIIERETEAVKHVLEDLRNIARPVPLEMEALDLGESARAAAESMRATAEAAGLHLRIDTDPGTLVQANTYGLGRVFRNLLQNAIQATAPGGTVSVSLERDSTRARLHIGDTGSGIPPERLTTIFDDYVTTKQRGLGLGLTISRRLVEQFGGTISVRSELGRGTVFTVELDLTRAAEEAETQRDAETAREPGAQNAPGAQKQKSAPAQDQERAET
jgi:signal transduction histidine kinase